MRPMLIVYCDREVTSATMAAGERCVRVVELRLDRPERALDRAMAWLARRAFAMTLIEDADVPWMERPYGATWMWDDGK